MSTASTRPPTRHKPPVASRARLLAGVLLAGVVLTGCQLGPAGKGSTPPSAAPTAPAVSSAPAARPPAPAARTLRGCSDDSSRDHPAEGPGAGRFVVTQRQLAVIDSRLFLVLCRQGLWRQGVGFGAGAGKDRAHAVVLINPGRSGLTARQVLDRLLGRG